MILTTITDLQKYISVSGNFEFDTLRPYIPKAIVAYTSKYVGKLHVFLESEATGTGSEIKNEAREYLRSTIANFGYYLFTPYSSVTMDSSGMANVQNQNQTPLQNWQIIDIKRELLRSGHESMDSLLSVLEKNPTIFTEWTEQFGAKHKELIVHNATEFQNCYNIFDSRQTFLALVPAIKQVEDQYIKTLFSKELIAAFKVATTGNLLELKEYCQKAIVEFTIAKVYDEGIFHLDASGIKLKFDTLPWEKVQAIDSGKQAEQLQRSIKKKLDNGTQYILFAKQLITDNPSDFSSFTNPLLKKEIGTHEVYNTTGIVSI